MRAPPDQGDRGTVRPSPYKAFVSSTYEDLKEHRAYVINVLRKSGIFVDPMEDWQAESDEPKRFSVERVWGCHFCVLLVALRRGYVPEGEVKSVTQLEYDAAFNASMDILPFLLDENAPWPRSFDELDTDGALRIWREELQKRHGRSLFGLDPKSIDVSAAVARWINKQSRTVLAGGQDWVQLISSTLDLPKDNPQTWKIAAELLPDALAYAKQKYSRLQALASHGERSLR